jgi:hypothetical protein
MATKAMATQPDSINYIAEVGDFLFATDTVAKIAKGQGTWGDAALVGVTAASFFVAPAKLMQLSGKALNAVIRATSKTLEEQAISKGVMSTAAKNAASKTLDNALTLKRQGTIPERPAQSFSGEFDVPVPRVGKSVPFEPEGKLTDKYNPEMAGKKYTRPMDEDVDPFDRDKDLLQEADDVIAKRGGKKKRLTKKELAEKDIESSQYYDKRKFTQDEIDERIERLSYEEQKMLKGKSKEELEDYVRGGDYEYVDVYKPRTSKLTEDEMVDSAVSRLDSPTETILRKVRSGEYTDAELDTMFRSLPEVTASLVKDEDKVLSIFTNIRTILAMEKKDPGLLGKNQKEILEDQLSKLKPEYSKIQARRKKGAKFSEQVEEEMPADIEKVKPEAKIRLEGPSEAPIDGVYDNSEKLLIDEVKDVSDLPSQLKPGTGTDYYKKVPNPEVVAIKVPEKARMDRDLREGLSVPAQKFAELQAEVRKLEAFNKANRRKTKNASDETRQDLNQKYRENLDLIEKYQKQILILKKATPEEEVQKAIEVSETITRRALERRQYPLGFPKRTERLEPGKDGDPTKYRKSSASKATSEAAESSGSVVRWNKITSAERQEAVYIGRGAGDKGKFGNPFPVGGGVTVKESVEKYRKYLWDKIKSDPEYARDIYGLKGKKLACPGSEANDACHGQIILKAIKYLEEHPELMKGK